MIPPLFPVIQVSPLNIVKKPLKQRAEIHFLRQKNRACHAVSVLLTIIAFFRITFLFPPQDDAVFIGKNSQIKPRKSEQGQGVKITFQKYDNDL